MIIFRPKEELQPRMDAIRADFARRYNSDELREQLYRTQEGLCRICQKPIQSPDGVCSAVDHVIAVYLYATWDYPIQEACEHANAIRNLHLVHSKCNTVKYSRDFEEFAADVEKGEISLGGPPLLTQEQLEKKKRVRSERISQGMLGATTPEQRSELARKATAKLTPEQRVENGRKGLLSLTLEQRLENFRRGKMSLTPEQRSENGRKAGLASVASTTPEQRSKRAQKGALAVYASMTPEQRSERIRKMLASLTPEQRSENSRRSNASMTHEQRLQRTRVGNCTRHHRNKGIVNPNCQGPFCMEARTKGVSDVSTNL